MLRILFCMLIFGLTPCVEAHYHILLPSQPSCQKGQKVSLEYSFGHPFEHELGITEKPTLAIVITPSGKKIDLLSQLKSKEAEGKEKTKIISWSTDFTPEERGDYAFFFISSATWMADEKHFLVDHTKMILHVETQKNWSTQVGAILSAESIKQVPPHPVFELLPLTRPYGLKPGVAFQVECTQPKFLGDNQPLNRTKIEWERWNPTPPKELPPDEEITQSAITTLQHTAVATLETEGWWCITGVRPSKFNMLKDKKNHPVIERASLWVYVGKWTPKKESP